MGSISTFIAANLIPREAGRQLLVSLHRVGERCEALNAHFQFIAALDGTNAAGGASKNHVAGQQGEIGRNETHQFGGLEDKLLGVRILPELSVLKLLDA